MKRQSASSIPRITYFSKVVNKTILALQHPVTGLLADTEEKADAWIRDNVYGILAVWALSLVYRKSADSEEDRAKAYELEQNVIRLMRGLLRCFMLQREKMERFKVTQNPLDSLHAKFDSTNFGPIVGDDQWGHMQIDAISLYLLILAETTTSGLPIIHTLDEVMFIQNLVFYIEAAYRTPDYGIWERGDKTNHGLTELNASSIGLAHAALRAMDGLNLFGAQGGSSSLIHTLPDETSMCHAVVASMLPRESVSKEVDSAVLAVIGYPAFAIDDRRLVELTKQDIKEKLEGKYGCKRFLRDGYKTALEDPNRLHYELHELKAFENIECEWPIFIAYLALDRLFSGQHVSDTGKAGTSSSEKEPTEADKLLAKLEGLTVAYEDIFVVPELYRVPPESVEKERGNPGSQPRAAWGRIPHKWAQSLYVVARLVYEKYVSPGELDPLNRRLISQNLGEVVTQVVLLAEDDFVQQQIAQHGIICQTMAEAAPIHVHRAKILSFLYSHLGKSKRLGLSGRASNELGLLATSKLYMLHDEVFAFTPSFIDQQVFYLSMDSEYLIDMFTSTVAYLNKNWRMLGRPTVVINIDRRGVMEHGGDPKNFFISTLRNLQSGLIGGHRVQLGTLKEFISTSCVTRLSFLEHSEHFSKENLNRFIQVNSYQHLSRLSNVPSDQDDSRVGESESARRMSITAKRVAGIVSKRRHNVYPPSTNAQTEPHLSPLDHQTTPSGIRHVSSIVDTTIADFVPATELTLDEFVTTVEHHGSLPMQHLLRPLSCSPASDHGGRSLGSDLPISPLATTPRARPSNLHLTMHPSPSSSGFHQIAVQSDVNELMESLQATSDLQEQVDLVHCLYLNKGLDWVTPFGCPVKDLVNEIGDRAAESRDWWLVRHTAGVLRRRPEDLAKCLTDILVRGKQVTIGLPPEPSEKILASPFPVDKLEEMIATACNSDPTLAVVTQELIVDVSMLMKSEPRLFTNMLRIRIGLIIQVMVTELSAMTTCTPDEATDHLFNLSPYQMKTLLSRVLSGSELAPNDKSMIAQSSLSIGQMVTTRQSKRSFTRQASHFAKELAGDHLAASMATASTTAKKTTDDNLPSVFSFERSGSQDDNADNVVVDGEVDVSDVHRQGQWFRRRRLDGSLNRTPVGFYETVWALLDRCEGLVLYDRHIPSSITSEMTQHELKFALHIEAALNRIPDPNYRQLFVEALSVLATLSEHDHGVIRFHGNIHIDRIIAASNDLFLEEQSQIEGGSAKSCCANFGSNYKRKSNREACPVCFGPAGICAFFYDSSPSGRFGTLTYLSRAALYSFAITTKSGTDIVDCPVQ